MNTQRLIESLEEAPVGDGDLRGEPFRVLGFQKRFLRGAFRDGVIRAGLSTGRGSGKTGLASALVLRRHSVELASCIGTGFEVILIAASFPRGAARLRGRSGEPRPSGRNCGL